MSGDNLIVDTNILIYLLNGDPIATESLQGHNLHISFVTELELLSIRNYADEELNAIKTLLSKLRVFNIPESIKQKTIELRQLYAIKLPDAIIAATAIRLGMPLLSADTVFRKVSELNLLFYDYEE